MRRPGAVVAALFLALAALLADSSFADHEDIPHNEVKNWALKFGVDLWEYGRQLTRMNELQRKYNEIDDADVVRKDGLILIRELAAEVKNMMDMKTNAVMRIMDSAEQAALSGTAEPSSKYLSAFRLNAFADQAKPAGGTGDQTMRLASARNPRFQHLPVNTSLSFVLAPGFVSDADPQVAAAVKWSEHLDPLFVSNYESDPSLSWQFFGSSTGFLRRYPGISWPLAEGGANDRRSPTGAHSGIYDFRSSAWFVGAATSPKDLLILVDSSGSMTGDRHRLSLALVSAILDTLSDNDFVNVYKFSDTSEPSVPCFRGQLAQASSENKQLILDSLSAIKAENIANFSSALITGFEILHKYNRSGQGCQCNQAIMLITDGPSSKYLEVFKAHNRPHMPVRVFTYLVGDDSSSANEMQWMACSNKGYFARVGSDSEAKQSVLKYIQVMARPMVMYQNDHPVYWSPVYLGGKDKNTTSTEGQAQLMTTVSAPVFDRRNHSERSANLLGVVGTDVPVLQIQKLVPPYKLGVNGYSFIVNNNGHVLYHPNLKIKQGGSKYPATLEPYYLNVDLAEVELAENENGPRENNTLLFDLRHDMIDQKEGETEIMVKVFYDEMKRITSRRVKYFYNPVENTPFSLGLAIPDDYGMFEFLAEQEIKLSSVNVTEYFKGTNWRIHPDWVYCEYNNALAEHAFSTAEERMLHFLSRTRKPGWKWMSLRPRSAHHPHSSKPERDSYYCDKTLVQSLVLDAIVTEELEKQSPHPTHMEDKHQGYHMFGVTVSFVATRSGLLRWTDHMPSPDISQPHFSENNARALDETWYRRAVDQHAIEPESFVFSVPVVVGTSSSTSSTSSKPLVTATHAVFVERKGHAAPAAVVGLQFQHSVLASHFVNITSACTGTSNCHKTCVSEELDCYVLDNNGFIIISENPDHTGRFFGQIDGTIMDSLVQDKIYKRVAMYDYQGTCSRTRNHMNAANRLSSLGQPVRWAFKWLLGILFSYLSQLKELCAAAASLTGDDVYSDDYEGQMYDPYDIVDDDLAEERGNVARDPTMYTKAPASFNPFVPEAAMPTAPEAGQIGIKTCDRKVDLFVLQPERLNASGQSSPLKGKLTNCHSSGCERPFSVQKIPHSNLILLVVDTMCPCGTKQLSIVPQEVSYDPYSCSSSKNALYRQRPSKCINYHPEEVEIHMCGGCSKNLVSFTCQITFLVVVFLFKT